MSVRQDRAELARPRTITIYEGRAASTHTDEDPLVYKWGKEYRAADRLPLIAAQLPGKPVTLLHPAVHYNHGGTAESIGSIKSARVDGDHVVVEIEISDAHALLQIQKGVHDLSLGYDARCDESGYQIDITVDHLALVPVGRCTSCELRADCGCENAEIPNVPAEIEPITPVTASSTEIRTDKAGPAVACTCLDTKQDSCQTSRMDELKELQEKLDKANERAVKAETELTTVAAARDAEKLRADKADEDKTKAEVDAQNARKDAEKAHADALESIAAAKTEAEKVRADAADSIPALVKTRVALESTANTVLGAADKDGVAIDRTALSDKEIKVAVIKHVDGDDFDATKPDLYIDGVFEGAVKRHRKGATALAETRQVIETVRKDGVAATTLNPEAAADTELRNRYSNAWKKDN